MTVNKKPADPQLHDLIKITWIDSFVWTDSPWQNHNDIEDDRSDIESVGYFIRRTARFLIFAQSITKHEYGGVFYIPVGCVVGMEVL